MARKKKKNRLWLWILLGVLLIGLIGLAINKNRKGKKGIEVKIEKAESRTIIETVSATGKIYPETEIKISSDVSGEIVELFVEEGQRVAKGMLLAKVKPDIYQSMLDRAQASKSTTEANLAGSRAQIQQMEESVKQAQINVDRIQVEYDRTKKLFNDGVISRSEFEVVESNLANARSAVESARANLAGVRENSKASEYSVVSAKAGVKEATDQLSKTRIYAPADGTISLLNIEKGEKIVGTSQMSGTELMRIANLNSLEVQVDVSENDILALTVGDTANIEVDAYADREFWGTVTHIANSANNLSSMSNVDQVTNFTVKIRLAMDSYKDLLGQGKTFPFRPGMSASTEIRTNRLSKILSLPIQAVTTRDLTEKSDNVDEELKDLSEDDLKEVVFVCRGDSAFVQEVTTGIQDDTYIHIETGLEVGDEVVVGPYSAVSRKLKNATVIERMGKQKKETD